MTDIATPRWGKYRGTVINNDDMRRRARLQVSVPELSGASVQVWAEPCLPYAGLACGVVGALTCRRRISAISGRVTSAGIGRPLCSNSRNCVPESASCSDAGCGQVRCEATEPQAWQT